jgi:hypothetical protein
MGESEELKNNPELREKTLGKVIDIFKKKYQTKDSKDRELLNL